jgi:hypothetical protein
MVPTLGFRWGSPLSFLPLRGWVDVILFSVLCLVPLFLGGGLGLRPRIHLLPIFLFYSLVNDYLICDSTSLTPSGFGVDTSIRPQNLISELTELITFKFVRMSVSDIKVCLPSLPFPPSCFVSFPLGVSGVACIPLLPRQMDFK